MSEDWQRFEQVTKHIPAHHNLYRASAPHYGRGATNNPTSSAVQFLTVKGIDSIISFNQDSYNTEALERLNGANIAYIHLRVADFTAPTLAQLREAYDFFLKHEATLVHCGYGHGRTGTGVTGLQLFATKGAEPPQTAWSKENHVETGGQIEVLRTLRDELLSQTGV